MMKAAKIAGIGAFIAVTIYGCASLKPNQLYIDVDTGNDTIFYSSSEIYKDYVTSEGWFTQSEGCISAEPSKKAAYQSEMGIDLQWDRTKAGCPWLGFGFGWDNWTGKDLSGIKNIAAVQFYVRMVEGERPALPWAVGLEDFTGAQAWLGVTSNAIKAEKVTTEWTRVEMPLSEFNWEEQDADVSNIKQIIFNTEADGHVYIDEIEIVPYSGGFRKRANVEHMTTEQFKVDGKMDDALWQVAPMTFGNNEVRLALQDDMICIALKVKDNTPLQNSYSGKDVYNGDAFEIAFSTDKEASTRRSGYLSTDQQIGFALSSDGVKTWDWREERELKFINVQTALTDDGYIFEARIKLADLDAEAFEDGVLYGLEMAVDHGDISGRDHQELWNDPANPGFHLNPSMWGEMYIMPESQALNSKD